MDGSPPSAQYQRGTVLTSQRNVNSGLSLSVLILLLMLTPAAPEFLVHLVFFIALSIPAWRLSGTGSKARLIMKVLAIPASLVIFISLTNELEASAFLQRPIGVAAPLSVILFLMFSASLILTRLMQATEIEASNILDTISLYLAIGFLWAYAYYFIYFYDNLAFSIKSDSDHLFTEFLYYSFVTLTTLGYGDITPITNWSKIMAIIEAIIGQFYVAVVVTYLLSLFINSRFERRSVMDQ